MSRMLELTVCDWSGRVHGLWASLVDHLEPGDWPTLVGTIFAGMAAFAAIWTLSKQRVDSKIRGEFELRRQASQIAAWVVEEDAPRNGSAFGSGAIRTLACVSNPSGVPIFNLVLRTFTADKVVATETVSLLAPGDQPLRIDISRKVFEKADISLEIEFVDGNGVCWRRDRQFVLRRTEHQ